MYGRWDNQMLHRYSAKGLAFTPKFERQFPTQGADRQEWQFKLEHQNDQCTEPLAMLGLNIHDRNQYASFIACLSRF
jgi:hypothetical protein